MRSTTTSTVLFALVVLLCLGQVSWWIVFHTIEAANLERASAELVHGDIPAAARALGASDAADLAETANSRRRMFVSEGIALSALVLIGIVLFHGTVLRERRLRRNQERFLTGATHGLKTPLATLRLGLESLLQGRLPAEKREHYLAAMVDEVDRLERSIDNLLTAAGLHAKGMAMRREAGDLAEDVRTVLAAMQSRFHAAGVRVEPRLQPVAAERDPEAMRLIVSNLLDNAAKYSRSGGRVDVELRESDGDALLTVADAGAGMSPDELPHVFERFWRGRAKANAGGSGLGLHLVQELVAAHGGTVTAHSAGPAAGSEFRVRLPLRRHASRRNGGAEVTS